MGNSHQRGWVVLRGKKWYGYYRKVIFDPTKNEERVDIVPVVLGLKAEVSKFQARDLLEQEIARATGEHLAIVGHAMLRRDLRGHIRVVPAQPLSSLEGSDLEAGDGQGEEVDHSEGSDGYVR